MTSGLPSLCVTGLAVACAVALGACSKEDAEPPVVRPVLSQIVAPLRDRVFGPFTGTIEPRYKSDLGFRAAGRMVSRRFNVGDLVSKGDLLASLDPTVAQFGLTSAKADLTNAEATLVNAAGTEQRKQALLTTGSAAQSQVDTAVADKDTAQAKVNQAQASLVKAREQLDFTDLHTDFDGVITTWSVEVGQVVTAGQTVVTVARPDVRDGVFDVPDDLLANIKPGATFTVALQGDTTVTVAGAVREIAPQSDAATRTRRIRLTLSDVPDVFRLGTTVTISLTETQRPTIQIPLTAVLEQDGKTSVWLVTTGNTATLTPVVLGARTDHEVTVAGGLAGGERLITAGVHSLSNGQPITLLEP